MACPSPSSSRRGTRARTVRTTLISTALILGLCAAPPPAAALDPIPSTRLDARLRCHLGSYALGQQRFITLTGADAAPRSLGYTLSDGRFGVLHEAAPGAFASHQLSIQFDGCAAGHLRVTENGVPGTAARVPMQTLTIQFVSDGLPLHGKLILPPGAAPHHALPALAVWVEGSNNNPSTDDATWPHELARRGVASFVYDKRGTGASGGAPTADFHARARDTVAALQAARRLAPHVRRVGVVGASQGGWVAPLVATLTPLDFVVATSAMAEGPVAQDQQLVAQQLNHAGYGPAEQALAAELTRITERIVRHMRPEDLLALDNFKLQHANEPWLKAIQPRSYTGVFLQFSGKAIQKHGPAMAQGLSFDFEPLPVIRAISAPQLWLLAGDDRQAPNASTQRLLRQLQQQRGDISLRVFPGASHGLIEKRPAPDGTTLAYPDGLFDLAARWMLREELSPNAQAAQAAELTR